MMTEPAGGSTIGPICPWPGTMISNRDEMVSKGQKGVGLVSGAGWPASPVRFQVSGGSK